MTEAEILEYLQDEVRRRAQQKGLSIERLADFAGLSQATLWKLLRGDHSPTLRTLCLLAEALECRPRDLLP